VPNITTTATSTGFVSESVTYVDIGLKLEVEPTIYPDGDVAIKIALEVSNIINQLQTKSGSLAYQIGTRNASTVLRLRDGENQVLAGLINDEDRRTANRVPGFGSLPIIGRLFGSHADDHAKTEIVLSITPRIVRNTPRPESAAAQFDAGTESSFRSMGIDSGGGATSTASNEPTPTRTPTRTADRSPNGQRSNTDPNNTLGNDGVNNAINSPGIGIPGGTGIPGVSSTPRGAQLRWQGPTELKNGDSFAVQLIAQSDEPIMAVPLAISYDPQVLQLTSVTEGDFLRQGGAQTSFSSRVDPTGRVIITANRSADSGATAAGSIVALNFRALSQAPDARVQLLSIAATGANGTSVNAPLPLPHTMVIAP